ncbi:hypothetical protein LCGC14_2290940, partial [marine sediment metagenome]
VKLEPERVTVFVPASRMNEFRRGKELLTETVDLRDRSPGQTVTANLHVRPPAIPGSWVAPSTVEANFTIAQRVAEKVFSVPVQVQTPKAWLIGDTWVQYKLLVRLPEDPLEWNPEIPVTGSRIDLEKLRPEDIRAYIVLPEGAKKPVESWLTAEVQVQLPAGLKVRAGWTASVSYQLVKRSGAAGS